MKKVLFAIICLFCVCGARAANENAATSKEYVDTELATKQPTIPAAGNDVVMTFDSTATDGIGTKNIYDESASYVSQETALVTAATANGAVQMALNGELTCGMYDPDNPTDCWLWNLNSVPERQLPAGYTALPYLESVNGQYIDTGIYLTANSKIETKFMPSFDYNYTIFGASNGAAYNTGEIALFYNNPSNNRHIIEPVYPVSNTGSSVLVQPNFTENQILSVSYDKNYFIMNGVSTPSNWYANYVGQRTVYLFATNRGDSSWMGGNTRIYYIRFSENGTLVRDFIPARRDSDGELGMYDTVSGTFFTNRGTGKFISGVYTEHVK